VTSFAVTTRVSLTALLALLIATSAAAQDRALVIEAEACDPEPTELGQRERSNIGAQARGAFVDRAEKLFIRLDQFESCMRRWLFARPGPYVLLFSTGATARSVITAVQEGVRFRLALSPE